MAGDLTVPELRDEVGMWGVCHRLHIPTSLFYGESREDEAKAAAYCAQCPVEQECYELAVKTKERHGVWGGVSFNQGDRKAAAERKRRYVARLRGAG